MNLSSLVCCENIMQESTNNSTHIVNPLQVFKLLNIPSTYSFSVSIGLINVDKNGKDVVSIRMENSNGEIVNELNSINLPIPPEDVLSSEVPYGILMNFDVRNMKFYEKGAYKVIVFDERNSTNLGEITVEVTT